MRPWLLAFVALAPAWAHAAHYVLNQVTVPVAGATNVALTTLNQEGDYGGTYQVAGVTYAFYVYHGHFNTLPPIPNAPAGVFPVPSSIALDGRVASTYVSYYLDTFLLVSNHNRYSINLEVAPYSFGGFAGLSASQKIFMTYNAPNGITGSSVGRPRHLKPFTQQLGLFLPEITSINAFGDVAGVSYPQVFRCHREVCKALLATSQTRVGQAEINDAGLVAASYADQSNQIYLLLQNGNTAQSFALPAGTIGFALGGFSNSGIAAGIQSITGTYAGLVFSHGTFRTFDAWQQSAATPTVVGVTLDGKVGVAVSNFSNGQYTGTASYLVTCRGKDC